MKNYYQILGLKETASEEDIRKAYRLYAQKFHPDKHGDDDFFKSRFLEIKEAYDFLIKQKEREKFDIHHHNTVSYKYQNYNYKDEGESIRFENSNKEKGNSSIQTPIFLVVIIRIFSFFIPFAGAAFMADATNSGAAAVITFIVLFIGWMYIMMKGQ